jgi:hypothetical protein
MTEIERSEETVTFFRKVAIVVLFVFVVVYPLYWWSGLDERNERRAKHYIMNYRGHKVIDDPWGVPYQVTRVELADGIVVMITSAGRDKQFDTDDDIKGGYRRTLSVTVRER